MSRIGSVYKARHEVFDVSFALNLFTVNVLKCSDQSTKIYLEKKASIYYLESDFQKIFNEVVEVHNLKKDMTTLKALYQNIEINANSHNYTPMQVNDAKAEISIIKEKIDKFVKKEVTIEEFNDYIQSSTDFDSTWMNVLNTYIFFLKTKYHEKAETFDWVIYNQKNLLNDKNAPISLINNIEWEFTQKANTNIVDQITDMQLIENHDNDEFSGISDYAREYVNSLNFTESNVGKSLIQTIKGSAVAGFYKKLWEIDKNIRLNPETKENLKDFTARIALEFLDYSTMSKLINQIMAQYKGALIEIAKTHRNGPLIRAVVKAVRKDIKKFTFAKRIQNMINRNTQKTFEEKYYLFFKKNRFVFLEKDAHGNSDFQKIYAKIIAYDWIIDALREMLWFKSNSNIQAQRMDIARDFIKMINKGTPLDSILKDVYDELNPQYREYLIREAEERSLRAEENWRKEQLDRLTAEYKD